MESRHILMFRGKIIQDGHTFYVYLRKDVQSVLEVIENKIISGGCFASDGGIKLFPGKNE